MKIEEGGKTTTRTSGCKFSGTAGTDSTNGPGAEDTYSVLATFSGEARGVAGAGTPSNTEPGTAMTSKAGVSGEGSLAQFFATGLAARILAEQGSSIVNTRGGSRESSVDVAKQQDTVSTRIRAESVVLGRVMSAVSDKHGVLEKEKLKNLVTNAKIPDPAVKSILSNMGTYDELQDYLRDSYERATKPLFEAI